MSLRWLIASPLLLVALTSLLTEDAEGRQRHNLAYASVAALKNNIQDTRGFQVEDMRVTDIGAACIRFHTRDLDGDVFREQAVVAGGAVTRSTTRNGQFEKEWNRQCLGHAYDVTSAVHHFF